jgi:hypothetical protein
VSQRIENTTPLTLLTQLPAGWAQTCIVEPPRASHGCTIAVLEQVRRVLRSDGTLWVFLPHGLALIGELAASGWVLQRKPSWGTIPCERESETRLFLLTKTSRPFYDRAIRPAADPPGSPSERREWLIRRCLLAGSSPIACGACGAPYRRARGREHPGSRYPTCSHHNPAGRCLVLDPYWQKTSPTGQLAAGGARSFLAIPRQPCHGQEDR